MQRIQAAIIGGGAAGFFAALRLAELLPQLDVHIFEKSRHLLSKVKVSGGGRCNVTHACFDPQQLTMYYPRGQKELRGPFTRFGPRQTVEWFRKAGVKLKTEEDGRMFPSTDSSQTIIDTFLSKAEDYSIQIHTEKGLTGLVREGEKWRLEFSDQSVYTAETVFLSPGSNSALWSLMSSLGIKTVPPVPSLFTFSIRDKDLHALSGLSVPKVETTVQGTSYTSEGPLLLTHWGMSGPAILKLSAFAARQLYDNGYKFTITINYLPDHPDTEKTVTAYKISQSRKQTGTQSPFEEIPRRLWLYLLQRAGIDAQKNWADISKQQVFRLLTELCEGIYQVDGKNTFKEEFVTCGGIDLKEINFTDYSLKKLPGIFAGGEFINVDAVTGGFNFQNAWTSGYLAAEGMADLLQKKRENNSPS